MGTSRFDWDVEKNKKLILERNISFEEIIVLMEQDKLLDIIENPSPLYKHQQIFVVDVNGYVHLVPFVINKGIYFLKTIFPSRKKKKEYLSGGSDDQTG